MTDDDDIQDYVSSGWRKRKVETETMKRINEKILEVNNSNRNDVLEEVAKEIENMKAFEKDTMASFAAYVRGMKQ